jgi:hypothetical protein
MIMYLELKDRKESWNAALSGCNQKLNQRFAMIPITAITGADAACVVSNTLTYAK